MAYINNKRVLNVQVVGTLDNYNAVLEALFAVNAPVLLDGDGAALCDGDGAILVDM